MQFRAPWGSFFIPSSQAALGESAMPMHNGHHPSTPFAAMWKSILAIAIGAAAGALLRWFLGLRLNSLFPSLPPGTLAANLVGGYIIAWPWRCSPTCRCCRRCGGC
ncbi:chromosome condensation membrane protein [Chromobacterium violaceum]|uniref:Fluoride-specific ion channel n=1 Tax=Chromobacterium violaceum TaxID=536 RepID=A0A3S4HQM7_CHRVL|nr:chromosome condensation membrane protein [Chromobacterium violaceum]